MTNTIKNHIVSRYFEEVPTPSNTNAYDFFMGYKGDKSLASQTAIGTKSGYKLESSSALKSVDALQAILQTEYNN